jgi:hypothetical protein
MRWLVQSSASSELGASWQLSEASLAQPPVALPALAAADHSQPTLLQLQPLLLLLLKWV